MNTDNSTPQVLNSAPATPTGFINFADLLQRLPVSPRTARDWTRKGLIPSIRPVPGGRVFYHWESVSEALKRLQHCRE